MNSMLTLNSKFARTRVYYNDDDWKFEDEERKEASVKKDEEENELASKSGERFIRAFNRQISVETNTLDRKLFTARGRKKFPTAWDHNTRFGKLRFKVHLVIDHIITRLLTMLLVIMDIVLMIVSNFDEKNRNIYAYITITVVAYFMLEAVLRIFSWGKEFFHHRLEVIDFLVIIFTFTLTVTVEALQYYQTLKYAGLIVIFRVVRIALYLKIFYGVWQSVRVAARNLIGQNKRRYERDGFNLDLTYITDRLIAMSFPSSGLVASYRNPIKEVAKFFNEKHPNKYMIWNLCSERHYDTSLFHDRVRRLMIDDHNVPKLSELLSFCEEANKWMNADDKNILAIHCKGGKGRTGTCIAAWLLYSGQIKTADKALLYFGQRRTDVAKGVTFQGVETPSQIRYVQYLEQILRYNNRKLPPDQELILQSLKITGLKTVGNGDGSDLTMQIIMDGKVFYQCPVVGQYRRNKDMLINKFLYDSNKKLKGDVKFRFISTNKNVPEDYDDCAFFFWIHTSFIVNYKFFARREEIGNCHKPKYNHIYKPNFTVTLNFTQPLIEIVSVG